MNRVDPRLLRNFVVPFLQLGYFQLREETCDQDIQAFLSLLMNWRILVLPPGAAAVIDYFSPLENQFTKDFLPLDGEDVVEAEVSWSPFEGLALGSGVFFGFRFLVWIPSFLMASGRLTP